MKCTLHVGSETAYARSMIDDDCSERVPSDERCRIECRQRGRSVGDD